MTDLELKESGATVYDYIKKLASPWTIVVAGPLIVALLDPGMLGTFSGTAIGAFLGTLPYIVFAVILIAYLKSAGAEGWITKAFQGSAHTKLEMATLFGGLAPFCSCEVIPFIAGLLAVGAPLAAVMAFWLSSPLIDPPTLLITASALGWPFAIAKAVAAVALGLAGGFAMKALVSTGAFENPLKNAQTKVGGCGPNPFDGKPVWKMWQETERRGVFSEEFISNAFFLIKWLAMAYVLEATLIHYVPASIIAGLVGGEGIVPIATAAVVGMPTYLNAYVAPPLLAGLTEQGMSLGAAMAFVIAGGVSSIPAMAAVWSLVKPRVFTAYILLGLVGAIIAGTLFQAVI